MQKDIIRVLKYFYLYTYYPTFKEIHTFLNIKIPKKDLYKILKISVFKKKIRKIGNLYTLGEYNIKSKVKSQKSKVRNSEKKLRKWRFRAFVKLVSLFSHIKLVGLSGSVAMNNAKESDDIDLFIIASRSRLWSARFLCILLALLIGIKRSRLESNPSNKACLNLFFEETNLKVPKFKQNYYVAHEIIQMKPLVNKNNVYERFLHSNKWVYNMFPNARMFDTQFLTHKGTLSRFLEDETKPFLPSSAFFLSSPRRRGSSPFWIPVFTGITVWRSGMVFVGNYIELILKKAQKYIINKHKTTELITDNQLWFFPDDFEEKLPSFARKKVN